MRFWSVLRDYFLPSRYNAHRPRLLRRGPLMAFLGVAVLCEAAVLGPTLIHQGPNVLLSAVVRSDVISYTDQAREGEGAGTLEESQTLDAAAQAKADDMAAKGYFAHIDPAGEEPWAWFARGGYDYVYAGENLAVRFSDSRDVVNAWMASPAHRANIVKPQYTQLGVGVADGTYQGLPATFVVQFFASPSPLQLARDKAAQIEAAGGPAAVAQSVPAPKPSFAQSTVRSFSKIFGDSRAPGWLLAGIATLLGLVMLLTFFIRIQVQPMDLLLPGLAVMLIAVTFLVANTKLLPAQVGQEAAVASPQGQIGDAASTEGVSAFPDVVAQ